MILLGIDPGIERTGYAFLKKEGNNVSILECGCISTSKTSGTAERLLEIKNDLEQLINKWKPENVTVESLFFAQNTKTAMVVGQARGVVLMLCQEKKLDIIEVTPLQVKIAATGYGKADKKQVQSMIQKILKLKKIPKPDDAADAVAIAWAGIGRVRYSKLK